MLVAQPHSLLTGEQTASKLLLNNTFITIQLASSSAAAAVDGISDLAVCPRA
jgi:hypothetical protein